MRTGFFNALIRQHQNFRRVLDGRQTVRNRERRSALRKLFKRRLHDTLAFVIERTRRFV